MDFVSTILDCIEKDNEVHFIALVDHFLENRTTTVHGKFPIKREYKVVQIDGVDRAKKVARIERDGICQAFWITLGNNVGQSLIAKVTNVLNP